ncbi:MAG: ABC transporter ATP-binding protein [Anaerolineae bacterium]|nr:ABC transporter ATP-binding protein [Anaerolineae bacterium]
MLEIHHLNKIYPEAIHAVSDLNLSLHRGQIYGLLGTNGAGKTTTIKMICGLVAPTSGTIRVEGFDVRKDRGKVMRRIGAVLEGTRNVYWRLTAWHNLIYFGRLKGVNSADLKTRAAHLLSEMGLWERRFDEVGKFSRGMQQKVAIAAALMADPPLLLLDEPTLGLDVQAARYVKDLLLKLAGEQGKTIILTTHQLDVAQSVCDRIAIMRQGQVLTDQPKDALMQVFTQEVYEIRLGGIFQPSNGLHAVYENQETLLLGHFPTQSELFGVLDEIRQSGLPLLSVNRKTPTLEDVFIHVLEQ